MQLRVLIPSADTDIILPINVTRLIWNAKKLFNIDMRRPNDLHPHVVIQALHKLQETLVVVPGADEISREAQHNATLLLNIHLRSMLASKQTVIKNRLSLAAFTWLVGEVQKLFVRSLAQAGEMAGTIAAQSMGEPATQMTLNSCVGGEGAGGGHGGVLLRGLTCLLQRSTAPVCRPRT